MQKIDAITTCIYNLYCTIISFMSVRNRIKKIKIVDGDNEELDKNKELDKKPTNDNIKNDDITYFNTHKKVKKIFYLYSTNTNKRKKYIKTLLNLFGSDHKFTNNDLDLIFYQIFSPCKIKTFFSAYNNLNAYSQQEYDDVITIATSVVSKINLTTSHIDEMLHTISTNKNNSFDYNKLDKSIISKDQWITFLSNSYIVYPLDKSLPYDVYKTMIEQLSEYNNKWEYLYSLTAYELDIKEQQNQANKIAPMYTYDNLITYMGNIQDTLNLDLVININNVSKWFLSAQMKSLLIDAYINKCIDFHKINKLCLVKYNYRLGVIGHKNFAKLTKENIMIKMLTNTTLDGFLFLSNIIIRKVGLNTFIEMLDQIPPKQVSLYVISNVGRFDISCEDFEVLLDVYIKKYQHLLNKDEEKELFISYISKTSFCSNNKIYNIFTQKYADIFFKFTSDDLENAYCTNSKLLLNYLDNKVMPNENCLRIACKNDNAYLAQNIINKKILPDNQCLLFGIRNKNFPLVKLLINSGCKIDNNLLIEIIKTKMIEEYDFEDYGVVYNNMTKQLCIEYNVNMNSKYLADKFPVSDTVKKFYNICKNKKWPFVQDYAIKHSLDFDQELFAFSCKSPVANPRPYYSLLKLYSIKHNIPVDRIATGIYYDKEPSFTFKEISTLVPKCKFRVTFDILRLVEWNTKLGATSTIDILEYQYNNPNFKYISD